MRGASHRRRRRAEPLPQSDITTAESVLSERVSAGGADAFVSAALNGSTAALLRGGVDAARLVNALSDIGASADATVRAAERALDGFIPAFGWTEIETGGEPEWLADPASGGRWPLVYWSDLDFRAQGALGDPRYVWEVNRHHYLVTLARAYALSGEARFASRVWSDLRSWIEANPPFFGINWSSALEVALRLMSWGMALDLTGTVGACEGDSAAVAASVALQAEHLSDNLSVYASSRNNHLIGEAAGLLVAGAKFPFLKGAGIWRRRGAVLLERELEAQVTPDGVTREQALHYEVFVLELGLLGYAASECAGRPLSEAFRERLGQAARFLAAVSGGCGEPPSIGDEDGGRAYELSGRPGRQAASAAACAAVVSGCGRPGDDHRGDLEPALWLFGPDSVAALLARSSHRDAAGDCGSSTGAFGEGGYFVMGDAGHHGVIDCGPLGYLSIAAHGHADCLSLSICHDGRWVIADPGTFCYHRDTKWRDHFRSTAAHNTLCVDGLSQSEMLGSFMWGRRAEASPLLWARTDRFTAFSGEHDGYRAHGAARHRRTVVLSERGYWIVVDFVDGSGSHRLDAVFQFAEEFTRSEADGMVLSDDDGRSVRVLSWLPEGMETDVIEGADDPPGGWISGGFGHRAAAPAVRASGLVELPATLVFALVPFRGSSEIDVVCAGGDRSGGAAVDVSFPGGRERVLFGESVATEPDERFAGVVGFETVSNEGSSRAGVDVREWTVGGEPVVPEAIDNLLDA